MTNLQGGCLCGKVRYTVSADPVFSGVCHCTSCQKGTGSAFSVVLAVPSSGVAVTGALTSYVGKGDSGKDITKRFCPTCGSPISVEPALMPDMTLIEVGTLDDPSADKPTMHIYCRSKMDWMPIPVVVGAFPAMPMPGA